MEKLCVLCQAETVFLRIVSINFSLLKTSDDFTMWCPVDSFLRLVSAKQAMYIHNVTSRCMYMKSVAVEK